MFRVFQNKHNTLKIINKHKSFKNKQNTTLKLKLQVNKSI